MTVSCMWCPFSVAEASKALDVSGSRLLSVIRSNMRKLGGEFRYGLARFVSGLYVQVKPSSRSTPARPEPAFRPSDVCRLAGCEPDRIVDAFVENYLDETNRRAGLHRLSTLDDSSKVL